MYEKMKASAWTVLTSHKTGILVMCVIGLVGGFFLVAMVGGLLGNVCADSVPEATGETGSQTTLIRELHSDPQYLNPILTGDYPSMLVENLIFDPLIDVDGSPDNKLVGRLARKWEISSDKLTLTFTLREGISWQDGKPFTAEDVKFTFDLAGRKDIPAIELKSIVDMLAEIVILSPNRIAFRFKTPYSPGLLAVGQTLIVPKHLLSDTALALESQSDKIANPVTIMTTCFNTSPLGTGPYTVAEWVKGKYIKLVRNEKYWDRKNFPSIPEVIIRIVSDRKDGFRMVKEGKLHIFNALPEQFLLLKKDPKYRQKLIVENFFEPAYYYIGWNMRPDKLFFTDKRVRRALTHAMDRKTFIEESEHGLGITVTGPFYYKSWAYNLRIRPLRFDLDKAAQLLDQAGWTDHDGDGIRDKDGVPFTFELTIATGRPRYTNIALKLKEGLDKLGIKIMIREFSWSDYLDKIYQGDYFAYVSGWAMGIDPDPSMKWHSNQIYRGANDVFYKNSEVDKLIEKALQEFEREKRQKLYWRIHEIIHDEQPHTFVHTPMEIYILSKHLKNYTISPFGFFDFYPGPLSWTLE